MRLLFVPLLIVLKRKERRLDRHGHGVRRMIASLGGGNKTAKVSRSSSKRAAAFHYADALGTIRACCESCTSLCCTRPQLILAVERHAAVNMERGFILLANFAHNLARHVR